MLQRKLRAETIRKANDKLYEQTGKMKLLRSNLLYAEVIEVSSSFFIIQYVTLRYCSKELQVFWPRFLFALKIFWLPRSTIPITLVHARTTSENACQPSTLRGSLPKRLKWSVPGLHSVCTVPAFFFRSGIAYPSFRRSGCRQQLLT